MQIDLQETEARLLRRLFSRHKQVFALVLGDFILDEYIRGAANRISPEAPVQVIEIQSKDKYLGGAGNVVNNMTAMGAKLAACGIVGQDSDGTWLIETMQKKGVDVAGMFCITARTTTVKQRIIAGTQQMMRLDREVKTAIPAEWEERITDYIAKTIHRYSVIIISDYKKGVLTPKVLKSVISIAKENGKPVIIDPKGTDYSNYAGATLITPNKKEASLASGIEISDHESLFRAGKLLLEQLNLSAVLITRSEEGMSLFQPRGGKTSIFNAPTKAREVYDITGAGDSVIGALGLCIASDIPLKEAVEIANIAGGISVGKLGTAVVTVKEIFQEIESCEMSGFRKVKEMREVLEISHQAKKLGKRVVLTLGCFDSLKLNQIRFLEQSKRMGDYLIVGIYSDSIVKKHFGEERPYIKETERAQIIAAMGSVDYLALLDDEDPLLLAQKMLPHTLTESSDSIHLGKAVEELEMDGVKVVKL